MTQVGHVCVVQGPQQPEPCDGILPQWGGKEAATPGRGGGTGGDKDNYHSIQYPLCPTQFLQVPWEIAIGVGQRLARCCPQPSEGTTEVGAAI